MSENNKSIDFEKISAHWIESSDEDFETMLSLFETKHYHWALFVGHLCLEKLLKALYIRKYNDSVPFIHNLYRLSEMTDLDLSDETKVHWLFTITAFNLNARYDDYKKNFYQKCTKEFTKEWTENITKLRLWILEKF